MNIPLSVSPRWDLFRFNFPKDFLPKEVEEKYANMLNQDKNIIVTPIDYLNESIQGISLPGIADLTTEQSQHSQHPEGAARTEHFNTVEPERRNNTYSVANPLSQISMEFTVTFRQNQGLYNYWMLYETIFYKILKQYDKKYLDDLFYIDVLSETGIPLYRIKIIQPYIDSLDGVSFSYNKIERSDETFDLKFKFNNIDIDFDPQPLKEEDLKVVPIPPEYRKVKITQNGTYLFHQPTEAIVDVRDAEYEAVNLKLKEIEEKLHGHIPGF